MLLQENLILNQVLKTVYVPYIVYVNKTSGGSLCQLGGISRLLSICRLPMNREELSNEIHYCARCLVGEVAAIATPSLTEMENCYVLREVRQFRPQPQQRAGQVKNLKYLNVLNVSKNI